MARRLVDIRSEIRALTAEEKEVLLKELLEELDDSTEETVERAWIDEARRRLVAYRKGEVTAVPAEEVFARIQAQFPE